MSIAPKHIDYRALLGDAFLTVEKLQARVAQLERERTAPIAIVGMACRFPGSVETPDDYWRLLTNGIDAIQEVPRNRWDADAVYDPNPEAPGKSYSKWGGFLDRIDEFDPTFFGISPREAMSLDPQQRLLLEVSWEALERAGFAPSQVAGTSGGVFVGISAAEFSLLGGHGADLYSATGSATSIAAGRIAYSFGLQGPCMAMDTACSSSLLAVHLAVRSLRSGECSFALAGGVNAILTPYATMLLSKGRMLAFDGRCKTFDASADGYVRSEGCGMVVLKRLSDAIEAGDRVLAVIRGSAANQDGRSSGLTAPNGTAQEALLKAACHDAGVPPARVDYVEAHGTGTSLGDPIEMRALGAVFGQGRPPDRRLLVGSVKTNIGHLEAAAGVAGLIKAVLVLEHGVVPPHLHLQTPSPHIHWNELPIDVPTSATAVQRADGPLVAGVSSFGFSGTNVHVILEQPTTPERASDLVPSAHLLVLSAHTETALRILAARYADQLAKAPGMELADVCLTANSGRAHFRERLCVTARTLSEMAERLRLASSGETTPGVRRGAWDGERRKVAFLFTGQGSQYVGMGRQLFETQPTFAAALRRCDELLKDRLPQSLLSVLYPAPGGEAAAGSLLGQTLYTQPALFAFEYALASLWMSWGVQPSAVAGHSVGEFVAACLAGVLSLEDALGLVAERARLMQALPPDGAMVAIMAGEGAVASALQDAGGRVAIAAVNGPENVVISGHRSDVGGIVARFERDGVATRPLEVSHAFHSPLMEPMVPALAEQARRLSYGAPNLRVISNVSGRSLQATEVMDADYWARHVLSPVRFADSLAELQNQGYDVFLEIGPASVLSALGRQGAAPGSKTLWLPSLKRGAEDWSQILDATAAMHLAGVTIDWARFSQQGRARTVDLPTYPFERQRYWRSTHAGIGPQPITGPEVEQTLPREHAGAPQDWEQWLYDVDWEVTPLDVSGTPARAGVHWVVFASDDGSARELTRSLCEHDACTVVRAGDAFEALADGGFVVNPLVRGDFDRVLDAVNRTGGPFHLVYSWAGGRADAVVGDVGTLTARLQRDCAGLLHLVQSSVSKSERGAARLSIITRGARAVPAAPLQLHVERASLWGFARVIALEHPELHCRCIDLDPAASDADVELIGKELRHPDAEDQVAYRGSSRHAARLVRHTHRDTENDQWRCHPDATYLITGGRGALGLRVAQWMVEEGARHIVLVGRSAPSDEASTTIAAMVAKGVAISVERADISNPLDVRRVLDSIREAGPPLRGVVHAAGVLADRGLMEQDWSRFERVLGAKAVGAWVLHELTREHELDFFVLFSSTAAVMGSAGQSNYAAANAFLDALAHHRHALGLPAISVNWGPWAESGMAARLGDRERARLAEYGVQAIDPDRGMAVFGHLRKVRDAQVAVMPVDWQKLAATAAEGHEPPLVRALLAEVRQAGSSPLTITSSSSPGGKFRERLNVASQASRPEMVLALVRSDLAAVLGFDPDAAFDTNVPLSTLGLDSLMRVELRNRMEAGLAIPLPLRLFVDDITARQLAEELCGALEAADKPVTVQHQPVIQQSWRSLAPIQIGGSKRPLFLVPGVSGIVTGFAELATALGPDQPVYGLQSVGLDGSSPPLKRIDDIAAHFVAEIRHVQPSGPYHLGGACLGGAIAFEIAQRLRASGEEVAQLALIDSWPTSDVTRTIYRLLRHGRPLTIRVRRARKFFRRLVSASPELRRRLFAEKLTGAVQKMRSVPSPIEQSQLIRARVIAANTTAFIEYRPKRYDGVVTLVLARDRTVRAFHDQRLGWKRVASCTVHWLPGRNSGLLLQESAARVASCLTAGRSL